MSFVQSVFVRDKFLGTSTREGFFRHGTLMAPDSVAWFCPTCGEVWARLVIQGRKFVVWHVSCERHDPGWQFSVAGSIWLLWDSEHNKALPEGALKRELEITMNHTEKWL